MFENRGRPNFFGRDEPALTRAALIRLTRSEFFFDFSPSFQKFEFKTGKSSFKSKENLLKGKKLKKNSNLQRQIFCSRVTKKKLF